MIIFVNILCKIWTIFFQPLYVNKWRFGLLGLAINNYKIINTTHDLLYIIMTTSRWHHLRVNSCYFTSCLTVCWKVTQAHNIKIIKDLFVGEYRVTFGFLIARACCAASISTSWIHHDVVGLVQKRRHSIAKELELRLSCTNPLIYATWGEQYNIHELTYAYQLQ